MAEKRTRYNELLGVDNAIRDPDLYQLLGLDRAAFDGARVDAGFRKQMSTLQGIKSPKHKSFIEFLKGELRRAKSTLSKESRRAKYDAELLEERREQLSRILDVVLADGALSPAEEERIQDVAAEVGLLPEETRRVLEEELKARGARREAGPDEARVAQAPRRARAGPAQTSASRSTPAQTRPTRRGASESAIQRAISKRLDGARPPAAPAKGRDPSEAIVAEYINPRKPRGAGTDAAVVAEYVGPPKPPAQPVVAEYVGPPKKPRSDWKQTARPAKTTGWGRSSLVREVGVCTSCLKPVEDVELKRGKAERLADGRLHCSACTNRLIAGLICATCYKRITRAEAKAGNLVHRSGRVRHERCSR